MKKNDENINNGFLGNIKNSFSGRMFRSGAYTTVISAVVIIIVLVVNLIVSKMDIQFDMSDSNMYTISDETKEYVSGLKDKISIYYMVQKGNESKIFEKIAKQYDKLSDKITLENKDPMLYPQFASKYVKDKVSENSFIVVNNTNGRAKYVNGSDMLIQEMNPQTYQTETTGIDVEGKLTGAIQYVTTEDLPKMYVTQGHGETVLGDTFKSSVGKMNVNLETLSTLTTDSIPKDCDILFINAPEKDFADNEATMIKNYLAAGGKAIITLDYKSTGLKNFAAILDYYGVKMVEGMVIEADKNMFMSNYPNYLVPNIESHDITTKASNNQIPVFMPLSSGLKISDTARSSLTVTPLLSTSDKSYSKINLESKTYEKESGDIKGPFYLGLIATDKYKNAATDLAVFSSKYTFTDDTSTYGNTELLAGTVGYMTGDKNTLSIPTKSLQESYIYPSQMESLAWGALTVAGIPLVIIIFGAVICIRRRRK